MLARTPSTLKVIGATVTSLGAVAAMFAPAGKAQTLANLDTDRATFIERQCGHILDATQRVGCGAQASIDFDNARTAAAKQRIEAANKSIAASDALRPCLEFLKGKRDSGTVFDRAITRDNACSYARELGMRDGPG